MEDHVESYPPRAKAALRRLAELAPAEVSLVVYGSLAKGTYREGESDVNLAVVVPEASLEALRALSGPLQAAYREARVEPFVLERSEIPRVADAFPVKLADIAAARHVIAGDDPFADVVIDREHLRLRVEQELRNHLVRLRHRAVFAGDDARALAKAIYGSASSLAIELGALLALAGHQVAPGASMRDVLRAAADAFELDRAVGDALASIKEGAPIDDPVDLFGRLIELLGRAVHVADRMEVSA